MKKTMIFLCIMVLALAGAASADVTYWYGNGTKIENWNTGNPPTLSGGWTDVLGANFESYGASLVISDDLSTITLNMFTEFGPATASATAAGVTVKHADLFLSTGVGGVAFDTAIRVRGSVAGTGDGTEFTVAYTTAQLQNNTFAGVSSYDHMNPSNTGWLFGGKYDQAVPKFVPVDTGTDTGNGNPARTVTWTTTQVALPSQLGSGDAYRVSVDLSGLFDPEDDNFAFLWGTGQCANDTIEGFRAQGAVPIPGAVLLLGAGLARLTAYARRRKTDF
jgi:hypothetical protein